MSGVRESKKGCSIGTFKKKIELDAVDQLKIRVILSGSVKPWNIEDMNLVRWVALYNVMTSIEERKIESMILLLKGLLGLELKENRFLPLSVFINPELVYKMLQVEEEVISAGDVYLSEDEVVRRIEELNMEKVD